MSRRRQLDASYYRPLSAKLGSGTSGWMVKLMWIPVFALIWFGIVYFAFNVIDFVGGSDFTAKMIMGLSLRTTVTLAGTILFTLYVLIYKR